MRKIKTVKIDLEEGKTKDYIVKELTVKNILELAQNNPFFVDTDKSGQQSKKSANGEETESKKPDTGLFSELTEFSDGLKRVIEASCDFKLEDLEELAPSEIKEIYDGFREVNGTFLKILEKVKLLEAVNKVIDKTLTNFSEMLAI